MGRLLTEEEADDGHSGSSSFDALAPFPSSSSSQHLVDELGDAVFHAFAGGWVGG